MILFFTGTGNSEFAAKYIADRIGDECVSLNDILKHRKKPVFHSERPFVIVAPIYASRYPKIITKLIKKAKFSGSRNVYFIATLASKSCSCSPSLQRLAQKKRLKTNGIFFVSMPNNYVFGGHIPKQEDAEYQLKYTIMPQLIAIAQNIGEKVIIPPEKTSSVSAFASGVMNYAFNKFMVNSDNFVASGDCIGCGLCASVCPVNNILMVGKEPYFRDKCLNCYSCINRCPKKAINIGRRTERYGRYVCPDFDEWKDMNMI